jgi:predicted AAA+ superfamily ATPase
VVAGEGATRCPGAWGSRRADRSLRRRTGRGVLALDSPSVPRPRRLLARIDRVLALAEAWLERHTGARLEASTAQRTLAFRWDAREGAGRLVPIQEPHAIDLDDLQGVERAVAELLRNTEQFVRGLPSNHVLLFGERGTGKSSSVKGLLPRFAARGLRLVEVRKEDLIRLADVVAALRGLPYRFLVFCDDLSFDEGEPGMRELKAALEGTLEATPANVRIVATSNRRHLVPERVGDNRAARLDESGELHLGEALEEKLALADRFGLVLGYYGFDQATYLRIVDRYADKAGVDSPREQLHAAALRFALDRSSRSGRVARQFVDDVAGRIALERAQHSA